jgi:hypothetical protein
MKHNIGTSGMHRGRRLSAITKIGRKRSGVGVQRRRPPGAHKSEDFSVSAVNQLSGEAGAQKPGATRYEIPGHFPLEPYFFLKI